ncbi:MAG: hypothetical protein IT276_11895 [Ignavibacteriaceae bacterium]|nr:hypothetical protein [Ignavibacterium sp.]MCC6255610.1 hypothetical protein [Ignavibacteriaceae bacterium]HMN23269.1 hypothetical protein [Ignavibacteriaceae bacterium]HRN26616.1 hypothetical protein [Ignavibacteriaceae bacterium]HRP91968.1 hypothetical protein [Ignavibacteriaceae bacterium]
MNLKELLRTQSAEILESATQVLKCAHLKSYDKSSPADNKKRILNLLTLTQQCVIERTLLPMKEYSAQIAKERFNAGFGLHEVQTAFNALEEELWTRITKQIAPEKLGEALGLISTVLGAGKEELALTYVTLASKTRTQTLNLTELFGRN